MELLQAVKCCLCGTLHEEKSSSYVKVNTGVTDNGAVITSCYCSKCFNKKNAASQQEQITKKGLLCG